MRPVAGRDDSVGERGLHPSQAANARALLIHPDEASRTALARTVSELGYFVRQVGELADAPRLAATEAAYPLVLISGAVGDRMARIEPAVLETVAQLRRASSLSQIILLIPATVDLEACCQAIESGVSDFVEIDCGAVDQRLLARRLDQARQRYDRQVTAAESLH